MEHHLSAPLDEAIDESFLIQLQQGRSQEAARDFEKAIRLAPPDWPLLPQTRELLHQAQSR